MGLVIELGIEQQVRIGETLLTVKEARKRNRVRLHFEGPTSVKINRIRNQGTLVPQQKEK